MKISRKVIPVLFSCALLIPTGLQTLAETVTNEVVIANSTQNSNILSTNYDPNHNMVTITSSDPTYTERSRCEYYNEEVPEIIYSEDLGKIKIEQNGTYCFKVYAIDNSNFFETKVTVSEITEVGNKPTITKVDVEYTSAKKSAKIIITAKCTDSITSYSIDNGLTWQAYNYFVINKNSDYNILAKSSKNARSDVYTLNVAEINSSTSNIESSGSVTDSLRIMTINPIGNAGIKSSYEVGEVIDNPGKISVTYSDGSTEEVFVTQEMLNYDFSKSGDTEVKIKYGSKEIVIPTTVLKSSSSGGNYWSGSWTEITEEPSPSPTPEVVINNPTPKPQVSSKKPNVIYDKNGGPISVYDKDGKPISGFDKDGNVVGIYDKNGNPIIGYDKLGNPINSIDTSLLINDTNNPQKIPTQIPTIQPNLNITYGKDFNKGIRVNADDDSVSSFTKDTDYLPFILPAGKVDIGRITSNKSSIVTISEGITTINTSTTESNITGDLLGIILMPKTIGYSDVLPNAWYYNSIMQASSIGFLRGTSNTNYSPKSKLTTKDTITALNRVMVKNQDFYMATSRANIEQILSNMQKNEVYYNRANILSKMKSSEIQNALSMIKATENTPISREQLAQLLYNTYSNVLSANGSSKTFIDTDSQYVDYCVKAGLLQGKSDSKFDPKANLTRAELATVLTRLDELYSQNKGLAC